MVRQLDKPTAAQEIGALAERQHGLVTRAQLRELGLEGGAIDKRVRRGALYAIHRGVYAVGHPRLTREGRFLAAVFSCGKRAALSHRSAAVLWGLLPERGPRIDVSVPTGGGRSRRRLVIVHRSALPPEHVTLKNAIPVTTPVRTIIDLADGGSRREVERAVDEAAYLRLDLDGLEPIPGRRGSGLLARLLKEHAAGSTRTRSDLEELMLRLCRAHALPQPVVNATVHGHEVDFTWPRERLAVETDGWRAHGTRHAFERDRVRDAELTAAGWRVVRITRKRLELEPRAVAAQVRRLLASA